MPRLGEAPGDPGAANDAEARPPRIGELLVEMGFIEPQHIELVLEEQKKNHRRFGQILLAAGLLTEPRLVRALSRQLGIPVVDPLAAPVHDRVRRMIPREVAMRLKVVPIALKRTPQGDVLVMATSDPLRSTLLDEVAVHAQARCEVSLAGETEIELAIAKLYGADAPSFSRGTMPPPRHSLPPLPPSSVRIVTGTPVETTIDLEETVPEFPIRGRAAMENARGGPPTRTVTSNRPLVPSNPPTDDASRSATGGIPVAPRTSRTPHSSPPPSNISSPPTPTPSRPPIPSGVTVTGAPSSPPPSSSRIPSMPPPFFDAMSGSAWAAQVPSDPVSAPPSARRLPSVPPPAPPAPAPARASMPAPPVSIPVLMSSLPSPEPEPPAPRKSVAPPSIPPARIMSPPERLLPGDIGAFDPLQPLLVSRARGLPETELDPVATAAPFTIARLIETGVELPEATPSMVDGEGDDGPLVLPETWQDVSFSGIAREAEKGTISPDVEVVPSWGEFFPTTSTTAAVPRGTAAAPEPQHAKDEVDVDVDVADVETTPPSDQTRTDRPHEASWEEDPIEEVPPEVLEVPPLAEPTGGVQASDPLGTPVSELPHIEQISSSPIEEDVEINESADLETRRPHAVTGVDSARALLMRAATGGELSPRELTWLVRCFAASMLDGLDDARLAAIVIRLGPPEA